MEDEEKKEEEKKEEEEDEIPELTPVPVEDDEAKEEAPKEDAPTEEAPVEGEKKEEEAPAEEAPVEEAPADPDEYKMPKPDEVGGDEPEGEKTEEYQMPSLQEVEAKESAEEVAAEEEAPEEEVVDLDAHDIQEHTACPKCEKDYVAEEKFCTECGMPRAKTQESVQTKEEIVTIKVEASEGNVYKAPALEWHDDEPRRFEVACYNCQNVFEASVTSVPTIINCTQCQTQLQIEEMPPEEEDEEDLEITPKEPSMQKVKPPKKACPACGGKTRFIPRHFKWFCDTCRRWI